ncbi:MAG: hypothetical protein FGM34_06880 [Solirubrobacteraceae bacterium]|nr:hypothetical protein [Solirubrobacteraceae bacterium]
MSRNRPRPVRSFDVGQRQDLFLIAAVTTVIIIRLQLWITNYPSLSPGKLHIAHLLWGGVFMTASIWMLSSYIGRRLVAPAAILGGIGFGFFIDEVGKFVTADNDYFFQPTAAIIYVVFIVLFLLSRWIGGRRMGERERIGNAAALASERYIDGISSYERQTAIELLEPVRKEPQARELLAVLESERPDAEEEPGRLERLVLWMQRTYDHWVQTRWFQVVMVGAVVVGILITAFGIIDLIFLSGSPGSGVAPGYQTDGLSNLKIANVFPLVSSTASSVIGVAGIVPLVRGDRIKAYRRFRLALMIAIFITYPFIFAESSFSAVTGMLITLAALGTVSAMLRQEEQEAPLRAPEPV